MQVTATKGSKVRISGLINTLNEERNIPYALRSLRSWTDEIVLVDMYSQDKTAEIAKELGATVVVYRGPGFNYAPRAFAINQVSGDWIIAIDADELVTPELSRALRQIADSDQADVVLIPRVNYIIGASLRGSGWGPDQDRQARFFRKGFIIASSDVHQDFKPVSGARVLVLRYNGSNAIIHFNYFDATQFIAKLNQYTSIEAMQAFAAGRRASLPRLFFESAKTFVSRYIKNRGYVDGWRGFYLSLLMVMYRLAVSTKLKEMEVIESRAAVEELYQRKAEVVLKGFDEPPTGG